MRRAAETRSSARSRPDRARRVIVLAREEARVLDHNYIGTEHILLGLIREGDGVAAQVLITLGADLNRMRRQVIQLLDGRQATEPAPARSTTLELSTPAVRARLEEIEQRLAAIERRMGTGAGTSEPTVPLGAEAGATWAGGRASQGHAGGQNRGGGGRRGRGPIGLYDEPEHACRGTRWSLAAPGWRHAWLLRRGGRAGRGRTGRS